MAEPIAVVTVDAGPPPTVLVTTFVTVAEFAVDDEVGVELEVWRVVGAIVLVAD
jgi:hypothetical protein